MPENQLRKELERLRSEVTSAGTDPESAQRLQALITEIEVKLAHPDDADQHHNLVSDIKEAITHFETEHPRATGILNDIMVTLSNMGI
ncbi:MAG: hypothetical protein A2W28_12150 [Gammaproteobacteria bacterium RBG_16_51_14]|nr:MAG: hypothetical protein A2W28_12150 [Gammaproteobacteria bacterium RBG_16_51_14]